MSQEGGVCVQGVCIYIDDTWLACFAKPRHVAGAQAYEHASDLIGVFREVRMGMETLVQIDRLVQILETPVFTFMRLHLLQPAQYPALLRSAACFSWHHELTMRPRQGQQTWHWGSQGFGIACHCIHRRRPLNGRWWRCCRSLYGLLMLLPQSAAFKTLHARLHSVPTLALLQLEQSGGAGKGGRFSGKRVDAQPSSSFNQHLDYEALLATFRRRQVSFLGPCQAAGIVSK